MLFDIKNLKRINIITGHYGSGKTNIAVNLAVKLRESGKKCAVIDLDIVNPYFRTADFKELFQEHEISLVVSKYANSNLDIPALGFGIDGYINDESTYLIIDVGGDDAGAFALGRYKNILKSDEIDMHYVINCYRYLTKEPSETLELMREIEAASKLKCTSIINNSNLGKSTTAEDIKNSLHYADKVTEISELPLSFTAVHKDIKINDDIKIFPIDIYVKTIWDNI